MNRLIIRNALFTICFFLINTSVFSQTTPKELVEKFFKEYESKGVSTALDNLYGTNEWMKRNEDALTNLKSQMQGLNEDYVGKFYGYEMITEKKFSESYHLLSYLVKYDRQPIRYIFQFYKPDKKWKIYSFKYDGNFSEELEEASKVYHLNLEN